MNIKIKTKARDFEPVAVTLEFQSEEEVALLFRIIQDEYYDPDNMDLDILTTLWDMIQDVDKVNNPQDYEE